VLEFGDMRVIPRIVNQAPQSCPRGKEGRGFAWLTSVKDALAKGSDRMTRERLGKLNLRVVVASLACADGRPPSRAFVCASAPRC